jgi:hypothetical protein
MPDITIKRNDAGKVLSGQFLNAAGTAVNCSAFTSAKIFMKKGSTLKIDSTFTFTNAATGSWSYTCTADDVDTSGNYQMEFEVGFAGGVKQTFPTHPDKKRRYLQILIENDLG